MKILVLCNKPPYPPCDGGSIASWVLIESLANEGNEMTVLAMNTRKHHITPYEIPNEIRTQITFHLAEVPAPITWNGALKNLLFSRLPYNAERFIDRNYSKKIVGLLRHQPFDVVQLEGLYLCPYIPVIRANSSATIVYRSHNVESEIWERTIAQSGWIKQRYLSVLLKRLKTFEQSWLNRYDLLVPITQRDEQKLNELGNVKPSLPIPAGIRINDKKTKLKAKVNDLFFIGALDWAPNTEGLLWFLDHCWENLLKKHPRLKLFVAGRNAPAWFVKKIACQNVVYMGEVASSKSYMEKHGIMIVPLLSGSGMRVKIIEAMARKKAIVTTPVGCEGIGAIHGQHLMIAETPEAFIEAIDQLIRQPNLFSSISENCFTFVGNHFSDQMLARKLKLFYEKQKS